MMGWFTSRIKAPSMFEIDNAFEDEGARAALAGKTRADCPYSTDNVNAWNFWVYGNENAQGEMRILKDGYKLFFFSTAPNSGFESEEALAAAIKAAPVISAADAVARGYWKPRYVTVAESSTSIWRSS